MPEIVVSDFTFESLKKVHAEMVKSPSYIGSRDFVPSEVIAALIGTYRGTMAQSRRGF